MKRLPVLLGAALALVAAAAPGRAMPRELRVCADPNNLPFSNSAGEGFENKIVELIAKDLDASVSYTWWAQRRGFARNTLKAGLCDLWPGVATGVETLATTQPYYRSTYVFLSLADRGIDISSFDDPRLRSLTVGVQMVGNDATNTPPAHALAGRGITSNVRGFSIFGNYTQPNPPAAIVNAVEDGLVDVAVVWGPLAGYFAANEPKPLAVTLVQPSPGAALPMAFDISMGVRQGDAAFKREIEDELQRNRAAINAILTEYHVPLLPIPAEPEAAH